MKNYLTIFAIIVVSFYSSGCEEKRTVAKVDNKAPGYNLTTLSGDTISSTHSINKVRLVVFWATWCKPCLEEIPVLNDLVQRYHGKAVDIHAISVDRPEDSLKVRKFVETYQIKYPVLLGSSAILTQFRSDKVPTTYLLSQKGAYVRKWNGPQPAHIFIREIEKLIDINEPRP